MACVVNPVCALASYDQIFARGGVLLWFVLVYPSEYLASCLREYLADSTGWQPGGDVSALAEAQSGNTSGGGSSV